MSKHGLQFHALSTELPVILAPFLWDPAIVTAFKVGEPPSFALWDGVAPLFADDAQAKRVAFTLAEPFLGVTSMYDFCGKNPGALVLEVGELSARGLEQSWLSTIVSDEATRAKWMRAFRLVKKATHTGVTVVNPNTGASAFAKEFRYSPGAKRVYDEGVRILPIGGNLLHLHG